jgi:outer membrane protein TolC
LEKPQITLSFLLFQPIDEGKGESGMKRLGRRKIGALGLNLILLLLLSGFAFAQDVLPPPGSPLTLDQCVAIALKYHPSLAANQATVEAQRARVEQALSAYYPQINFNTGYNASTSNFSATSGTLLGGPTRTYSFLDIFSLGPAATMTIYDFGRTRNSVQINRENVNVSLEDLETTRQNVILNVKTAYYNVLQTQYLIDVAQDVVNQTQQHLDQAQGFFQAGTRPKIDVTKAEVDVANAELALIQAKNNFAVARVNLNNAIGLRQDLTFAIDKNIEVKPRVTPLEEILSTAYRQRPEILRLKAQERSQEAAVKLAQSGYYPVLSGNAQYIWRSHHIGNDLYWDWILGANLTIPIFSGFLSPNQVAEARATLRNLQAQEESTRQNIRLEAEQAYLNHQLAIEQIDVTRKSVEAAKENYDLASGRYQVGVGSPLEITDAEVQLANARANNIQAIYGFKTAEARIEKAMGLNR